MLFVGPAAADAVGEGVNRRIEEADGEASGGAAACDQVFVDERNEPGVEGGDKASAANVLNSHLIHG